MEAKLNLKLISNTPDPERLVATAASLCYSDKSIDEIIKSMTLSEAKKLITMLDEMGHDSVFEHVSFTFGIEGVSRILLAQLTRHRISSYSVRSQRYVPEIYFKYIIPEDIKKFELEQSYIESIERNQQEYNCMVDALMYEYLVNHIRYHDHNKYNEYLLDKKSLSFDSNNYLVDNIPYLKGNKLYNKFLKRAIENSRYLLPGACETKIIMTINARSLFNLFGLRSCFRAQDEIWRLIITMIKEVKKVAPNIFANSGPECLSDKCKQKAMSCGRQEEIKKIIKGE